MCPGFVGNRMLAQRGREAQALLDEGAMPWDVDRALYDFGFAMGPFQMIDLAGLDIGWVKERSTGATIRDRLCELDRRGQKTGAGYYDYDANRNPSPSPVTEGIVREFAAKSGKEPRTFTDAEIVERLIYPMINEGAKILEEGKAIRASDIDVIWINGYNWPAYRGGPMFYADQIGLDKVVARLRELEATAGPQWTPAPLLERLAADGQDVRRLAGRLAATWPRSRPTRVGSPPTWPGRPTAISSCCSTASRSRGTRGATRCRRSGPRATTPSHPTGGATRRASGPIPPRPSTPTGSTGSSRMCSTSPPRPVGGRRPASTSWATTGVARWRGSWPTGTRIASRRSRSCRGRIPARSAGR